MFFFIPSKKTESANNLTEVQCASADKRGESIRETMSLSIPGARSHYTVLLI